MKKIVAFLLVVLATLPAYASGMSDDIVVHGNRAVMRVWNYTGGRMACHGEVFTTDIHGNTFRHEDTFRFPAGEVGPHGIVVLRTAPIAGASYNYECAGY